MMNVIKIIFAAMVCIPVLVLASLLFTMTVDDAAYGTKKKEKKHFALFRKKKTAETEDDAGEQTGEGVK